MGRDTTGIGIPTLALLGLAASCEPGAYPDTTSGSAILVVSRLQLLRPAHHGEAAKQLARVNSTPPRAPACPVDMQLARGEYCPEVEQPCLRWMDPPGRYHKYRCAEYGLSQCLSVRRIPMSFCIDRLEYTRTGDQLPLVRTTWHKAQQLCAEGGKRLCTESEWQFACEGAELRPYPYGAIRDSSACNIDRQPTHVLGSRGLFDLRAPSGSHPRCASPFGVLDMSGNVQEWVANDRVKQRHVSILKGAWWHPGRGHCRAAMPDHGPLYAGLQVGFRCCRDADQPHSTP